MLTAAATMSENSVKPEARLTIRSRFEELATLWTWVEAQAAAYGIPTQTEFAIQLCLEEAVSNVIRHGHTGQPDLPITIVCTAPQGAGEIRFTIEDQAPPFNPLEAQQMSLPSSIDDVQDGGRGIHLMRGFSGKLAYQRLAAGNRLTISFPLPVSEL